MAITIDKSLLVVRSVTDAMRGQKLLERHGITAVAERNTAQRGGQSCGYALRVTGNANDAVGILAGAGISVTEIRRG